jgi:hypothetical protein
LSRQSDITLNSRLTFCVRYIVSASTKDLRCRTAVATSQPTSCKIGCPAQQWECGVSVITSTSSRQGYKPLCQLISLLGGRIASWVQHELNSVQLCGSRPRRGVPSRARAAGARPSGWLEDRETQTVVGWNRAVSDASREEDRSRVLAYFTLVSVEGHLRSTPGRNRTGRTMAKILCHDHSLHFAGKPSYELPISRARRAA